MTDKELIKRIAEIENLVLVVYGDHYGVSTDNVELRNVYPLSEAIEAKAFCWDLMIKYGVSFDFVECPAGSGKAYYGMSNGSYNDEITVNADYQSTPQRAILLAVTVLHEEKK